MVTLKNNTNRRQIFELPHDIVCTEDECRCNFVEQRGRTHDTATGEIGTTSEQVRLPGSVFIPARATSQALPDAVLNVPAVVDAINRGLLEEI